MYETINEHLRNSFYNNEAVAAKLKDAENTVLGGVQTSFAAAGQLLDMYYEQLRKQG